MPSSEVYVRMSVRHSGFTLIAILLVLSVLAGVSARASDNETLLQKMKREGATLQVEDNKPAAVMPVKPPVLKKEPEEKRGAVKPSAYPASPTLEKAAPPPATTRPARPLEWPPEHFMEDHPLDDEGDEKDDEFKTLRVPYGDAAPVDKKGRRVATFVAAKKDYPVSAPAMMPAAAVHNIPVPASAPAPVPVVPLEVLTVEAMMREASAQAQTMPPEGASAELSSGAGYVLGSGDKVKITVFGEEDLSGVYTVNDAGQISYPLIGEVMVRGLSLMQAKERIAVLLQEGYLRNPDITIEMAEFRPFYITGEVRAPGSYNYVADMSIMNAVVLAGGFTFRAEEDEVEILRNTASGKMVLKDIETDEKVVPGDIILVKERFF